MVLSSIRIQGFRGLKDLNIDKMNKITTFVGRNNMGKSACLEAICLLQSGKNEFDDALGNDLIKQIMLSKSRDPMAWNYLIHKDKAQAIIAGSESNAGTDNNESHVIVSRELYIDEVEKKAQRKFIRKRSEELEKFRYRDIDEVAA